MKYNEIVKLNESLERAGITFSQATPLLAIQENPGLRAGALGKLIGTTSASASCFINLFNKNGWVKITNDANDRRVVLLNLTAKGEAVLKKLSEPPQEKKNAPKTKKTETVAAETTEQTVA